MEPFDYVHILSEIEQMSNGANLVQCFLEKYPDDFIKTLCSWIQFGEERCDMCMLMIYVLKYMRKSFLLSVGSDQSILHLAATFHECQRLVTVLLETAPELACQIRQGPHAGLTPLHIIVSKGDFDTTQAYLKSLEFSDVKNSIKQLATGSRFYGTVLMGQTALSASILKFVPEEISPDSPDVLHLAKLLLDEGAAFDDQNSLGDTVIHTLIRYAHLYPERREQVLEMMAEIQSFLLTPNVSDKKTRGRLYARRVWFCQNREQMTALQLAATLGEHEIVCFIMELQWIYRTLHDYDGIFETNNYDITEIDTIAKIEWYKNQEKNVSQLLHEREPLCKRLRRFFLCHDSLVARQSTPAILEVICEVEVEAACNIISTPVVNKLIDAKWRKYRIWFYSWAAIYLLSLLFLSVYASLKFRYVHFLTGAKNSQTSNNSFSGNISEGPTARIKFSPDPLENPTEMHKLLVNIGCFLAIFISMLSLYLEWVRSFVQRKSWNLLLVHHNGSYRLLLLLNAIALGVDSIWYLLSPTTNNKTPLVLALLFGWWFSTFFLRPFKKFSFFTVMLMKVLVGDMLRFFTIIIIALISFTMAMHLLFLHSQSLPKEFESLPLGCLTMFKLMLGLTDLEILERAEPVWLAVTLFVVYVLLTYVLLINSLIAMMSNTCSEIAGQKSNQWKIQRLSVILFIENMMLCGLVRTSGKKNYFRKNDEGNELEARYVIEDTKLSLSVEGGNRGHDIQSKGHYVLSLGANRPFSSVEDLWSLSDNLSQNSKRSGYAESNVSLANSFVKNVGKKYRQASRRSRSSRAMSENESVASSSSFESLKEANCLTKLLCPYTTSIIEEKRERSKYGPNDVKAKLNKPKTQTVRVQNDGNKQKASETVSLDKSEPRNQSPSQGSTLESTKTNHKKSEILTGRESDEISGHVTHRDNGEEIIDPVSNEPNDNKTASFSTTRFKGNGSRESVTSEPNNNATTDCWASSHRDGAHVGSQPSTPGNAESIELDTLLESLSSHREDNLLESHALVHRERLPSEQRLSQDSAQSYEFIDEIQTVEHKALARKDQETVMEVVQYNTPLVLQGKDVTACAADISVVPEDSITEPPTNEENDKTEKTSPHEINKEERGKKDRVVDNSSHETDPQWAALLQSIRNLDRDKRNRPREKKKLLVSDARQRRNAFIKGLGSSHDYSAALEAEDYQYH